MHFERDTLTLHEKLFAIVENCVHPHTNNRSMDLNPDACQPPHLREFIPKLISVASVMSLTRVSAVQPHHTCIEWWIVPVHAQSSVTTRAVSNGV